MIVFLNPYSDHGKARTKWNKIRVTLRHRLGDFRVEQAGSPDSLKHLVSQALQKDGPVKLIAAGGDGTVHQLLNAVMQMNASDRVVLGAVGIGSSNDFHKPFRPNTFIDGVPVRADFRHSRLFDVIRITFRDPRGHARTRYSLINASIGITAEGNALFNNKDSLINYVQKISENMAIMTAALTAIFRYRDVKCRLKVDDGPWMPVSISNLGIIKNPHFTGSLCYDTSIRPDDGVMGVNLCTGLSLAERVRLLMALQKGRFSGLPKTQCWKAGKAAVKSDRYFSLEMDGEVFPACAAEFKILPQKIRCCP